MTDANKNVIAALLDRSGSMQSIAADIRGGSDSFVAKEAGHENASTEWTVDAVRALIAQQETVYGWDFVYDSDGDAVGGAWDAVASYSSPKRSRGAVPLGSIGFEQAERRAARTKR